jgi:hypothetical protein
MVPLNLGASLRCVIPNARVFTSGRRDLAWSANDRITNRPKTRNKSSSYSIKFW